MPSPVLAPGLAEGMPVHGALATCGSQEAKHVARSEAEPWMAEPSGSRGASSSVPASGASRDAASGTSPDADPDEVKSER